jgi:hypothetical protein
MRRIYHHYLKWEEVHAGMWDIVSAEKERELLPKAIEFTGNAELYGSFMMRIIREWPYSCEQAFTNPSMNHWAWVGHAACCLAILCPEYITRKAWGLLTQKQQDEANAQAELAVQTWSFIHRSKCGQLGFIYELSRQMA